MTSTPNTYKINEYKLLGDCNLKQYIDSYCSSDRHSYAPHFAHVIINQQDNSLVMQSAFWTCKDYMMDCYNNDVCPSVKYNKTVDGPIYDKECRILLLLNHKNHVDNLLHNIQHLHHYEKQAHFKQTKIHDTDYPQIKCIQASGMWMKNSFMLSTFLSLVRLCVTPKKETPDFVSMYTSEIVVNEHSWYTYTHETHKQKYNKNFQLIIDNLRKFAVKYTTISPAGTAQRNNAHGIVGLYRFLVEYGSSDISPYNLHKDLAFVFTKLGAEKYVQLQQKDAW